MAEEPWTDAQYAVKQHEGTELGAWLNVLIRDIEADRQALRRVMAAAGVRPDPVKQALAWAAEKAGRLKLNGRLLRRSPLAPLLEIEAAELGITGKLLLWRVLRARRPPGADAVDLDALIARAERQRDAVEEHRTPRPPCCTTADKPRGRPQAGRGAASRPASVRLQRPSASCSASPWRPSSCRPSRASEASISPWG